MQPVLVFAPPAGAQALALVCDSPHSGTHYPEDFGHAIDRAALRRSEDTHVDALWSALPQAGATLLCATFPRSYIDANRQDTDVDPDMVAGGWPHAAMPGERTRALGNGLIWTQTPEHRPIYGQLPTAGQIRHRIDAYWRPYRDRLLTALEGTHARHGACWHLNLHSMPSNVYERLGLPGRAAADIVLGDRHGSSCEPAFVDAVGQACRAQGLQVALNDPYEGAELVRFWSDPSRRRHSLQIEINRALYMDEATREPNAGFAALKRAIDQVVQAVAGYVRAQTPAPR